MAAPGADAPLHESPLQTQVLVTAGEREEGKTGEEEKGWLVLRHLMPLSSAETVPSLSTSARSPSSERPQLLL